MLKILDNSHKPNSGISTAAEASEVEPDGQETRAISDLSEEEFENVLDGKSSSGEN